MQCAKILMRLFAVGFHDGDFDEKEGEEGENGSLNKADKDFKCHEGDWRYIGREINDDEDQNFTRENVAKKSERE